MLPRGVTTIAADPHEIGNMLGLAGMSLLFEEPAPIPSGHRGRVRGGDRLSDGNAQCRGRAAHRPRLRQHCTETGENAWLLYPPYIAVGVFGIAQTPLPYSDAAVSWFNAILGASAQLSLFLGHYPELQEPRGVAPAPAEPVTPRPREVAKLTRSSRFVFIMS